MEPDPTTNLYQGAAGREYHEGKRALRPEALAWVMRLRGEKLQPYVRPSDDVFEFGVGSGWNLGRLDCSHRLGCDAATFLAGQVRSLGIEFVPEVASVPDAAVDVVICHHTLEHVVEPARALREFRRILKAQGTLILHVPWERERRYATYQADEPNHHLFNWNPQNLGNLVSALGFKVLSVTSRRYGYDRFAANLAGRLHLGENAFRLLRVCMIALRPLREVELVARADV